MGQREGDLDQAFLRGEGVVLRGLTPDDAEVCAPWFNNSEVNRWLATGIRPNTVESSRDFIMRALSSDHDILFAIIERSSGRHIGNAGLHRIHPIYRSALFGIVIGVPELWHRGYGTETTRLVTGYAFSRLNLNRVELEVVADNVRARHAYERVGYRVEGVRRQAMYVEGGYVDALVMAILRAEWDPDQDRRSPARKTPSRRSPARKAPSRRRRSGS